MGRNKKTDTQPEVDNQVDTQPEVDEGQPSKSTEAPKNSEPELTNRELELMRLYPQYEKIWITPQGFVRPEGTPEYLLKGAKLYKNKFYNK